MICPLCNAVMENGTTSMVFNMDGGQRTIVVLNIPALICEQCGDEFIQAETAQRLETIVHKSEEDGLRMGFLNYSQAA